MESNNRNKKPVTCYGDRDVPAHTTRIKWESPLPKNTTDALVWSRPIGNLLGIRFRLSFAQPQGAGWDTRVYRLDVDGNDGEQITHANSWANQSLQKSIRSALLHTRDYVDRVVGT